MAPVDKPILFHYPPSIYSHRVLWYLWLRGIDYDECIQPPVMPRPDLASIGVGYRRIPIMAIGKDFYCDSRLIISKLESLYPNSNLAPSSPAEAGVRKLFENYTIDGGIFANAVKLMPYWKESGLLQNKVFLDDRQKLMGGRRMTEEMMEAGRSDGLQQIRQALDLLENTFLADGREWILGSKEPTVADIDAVWPFEWLILDPYMQGCLPEAHISDKVYPRVYSWLYRFMGIVDLKKQASANTATLDGGEMLSRVSTSSSKPDDIGFIDDDPLQVQRSDEVEIFPMDYGNMEKTFGSLVGLSIGEVVIQNAQGIFIHFPRWNFAIKKHVLAPSHALAVSSRKKIPKMRLIYHHYSPYTRKVFMLAHELGLAQYIELQKVVVCPVPIEGWSDNNNDVSQFNPMTKIPCLVPEDIPDGIYDSNIICEYLEDLASIDHKKDEAYWRRHTLHACADGIMDAAVLITYEVRIRKERGIYFEEWAEGQRQKILRGLDRLESAAKENLILKPGPGPASADEVAIAVATAMTGQMAYLGIEWTKSRPNLEEWLHEWEQRPSFKATPPEKDWVVPAKPPNSSKM